MIKIFCYLCIALRYTMFNSLNSLALTATPPNMGGDVKHLAVGASLLEKTCTLCEASKTLEYFDKQYGGRFGVKAVCKECRKIYSKKYRTENNEKCVAATKLWRQENYREVYSRKWERHNERMQSDPLYKLTMLVRRRTYSAFRRTSWRKEGTRKLIGCSFDTAKKHIEALFTEGMSWNKVGCEIHIDHKIPLASAKTKAELIALCHYTNLQPLWALDNIRKGCKII